VCACVCVCVCGGGGGSSHLVPLRVHVHGARSEPDGLVFEDVAEAEPSDLHRTQYLKGHYSFKKTENRRGKKSERI